MASKFHAKATTTTIRAQLITVPARIARPDRPPGPANLHPPPPALALAERMAGDVHHRLRTTGPSDLTTQPPRRGARPRVENPGRPATPACPNNKNSHSRAINHTKNPDQWIQAEVEPRLPRP